MEGNHIFLGRAITPGSMLPDSTMTIPKEEPPCAGTQVLSPCLRGPPVLVLTGLFPFFDQFYPFLSCLFGEGSVLFHWAKLRLPDAACFPSSLFTPPMFLLSWGASPVIQDDSEP